MFICMQLEASDVRFLALILVRIGDHTVSDSEAAKHHLVVVPRVVSDSVFALGHDPSSGWVQPGFPNKGYLE